MGRWECGGNVVGECVVDLGMDGWLGRGWLENPWICSGFMSGVLDGWMMDG